MKVMLNGEPYSITSPLTITSLLQKLDIRAEGIAVALNDECIPRSQYPLAIISESDEIEILTPMAGG